MSVDAWITVDVPPLAHRFHARFIIIFLSFLIKTDANLILLDFHFFPSHFVRNMFAMRIFGGCFFLSQMARKRSKKEDRADASDEHTSWHLA